MLLDVIIKELKKEAPSNKRRECIKGLLESGHKLSSQITGDMRRLDIFSVQIHSFSAGSALLLPSPPRSDVQKGRAHKILSNLVKQ